MLLSFFEHRELSSNTRGSQPILHGARSLVSARLAAWTGACDGTPPEIAGQVVVGAPRIFGDRVALEGGRSRSLLFPPLSEPHFFVDPLVVESQFVDPLVGTSARTGMRPDEEEAGGSC